MQKANADPNTKVILVYGSKDIFSAGADIFAFERFNGSNFKEWIRHGAINQPYNFTWHVAISPKPVVVFARGMSIGIIFSMMSNANFIYCTHDAKF